MKLSKNTSHPDLDLTQLKKARCHSLGEGLAKVIEFFQGVVKNFLNLMQQLLYRLAVLLACFPFWGVMLIAAVVDGMLDENVRRPISPAAAKIKAAKIKDDMAYQAKEQVLKKIAKKLGLFFTIKAVAGSVTCKLNLYTFSRVF